MSPSPKAELRTSDFDYALPRERIASHPRDRRDESRLLVLHRDGGAIEHRRFRDLPEYLPAGDALVLNETRVIPARLRGRKTTGARAEILLLHPLAAERPGADDRLWTAIVRPGGKLRAGAAVRIADDLALTVVETLPDGRRVVRVEADDPTAALRRHGEMPLPPYIERPVERADAERYQTVYARSDGSVAAPTAGLHFTDAMLRDLEDRMEIVRLVLHIGVGTFRPVDVEDPSEHPMHAERYAVPVEAARRLADVRSRGGSTWAVGTTVVRTLESVAGEEGGVAAGSGWTSLFIRPGYRFRAVDHLLTNFHLPRSTLLMLVAAFGGYDVVMAAYRAAVEEGYRFYSYGDAMLVI